MDDDLARLGQWPSFICIALSAGDASKVEAVSRSYMHDFLAANADVLCAPAKVGQKREREEEEASVLAVTPSSSPSSFVATERAQLHVSLSKLFLLRHHQIVPFVQRLGQLLAPMFRSPLSVSVGCDHVAVLANEEKTRSYVALTIGDHHHDGALLKLVGACNDALRAFNAPTYHDVPVFHVSTGYFPYNDQLRVAVAEMNDTPTGNGGTPRNLVDRFCSFADDGSDDDDDDDNNDGNAAAQATAPRQLRTAVIMLRAVECRIGNRVFRLASSGAEFLEIVA